MSANVGAKDIVTEGLVLYLDAANYKSYTSGSTVWRDMSGNDYTGSLVNGPTFSSANGGSVQFDGINDYSITNYTSQLGDFTAISWFKSSAPIVGKGYDRILEKSYDLGFWMGRYFNSANQWGGGVLNTTSPTFGIFVTLADNSWHFLASVRSGSNHTIYGDGITNTNTTTCSNSLLSNTALTLGTDYANGYLNGNIASVQIYNRALSAAEILQNYNATKNRFGIQ
jgi:hypothetical protein